MNSTTTSTSPRQTVQPVPDLRVENMGKRFGNLVALDNVSLHLQPGSFHALLGENGAGKSTLVKCMMGFYTPDQGQILINQAPQAIASPRDAHHHGIGMVYQHFTSVPAMTVAENLVISRFETKNLINWKQEFEHLQDFS
jgi:general nucleoside transport system ATP-binding protein